MWKGEKEAYGDKENQHDEEHFLHLSSVYDF